MSKVSVQERSRPIQRSGSGDISLRRLCGKCRRVCRSQGSVLGTITIAPCKGRNVVVRLLLLKEGT